MDIPVEAGKAVTKVWNITLCECEERGSVVYIMSTADKAKEAIGKLYEYFLDRSAMGKTQREAIRELDKYFRVSGSGWFLLEECALDEVDIVDMWPHERHLNK